jgi:glycosyltransferase involved in cell wall biosynthesis
MTAPFLSVVIPLHNEVRRLHRCVVDTFGFLSSREWSFEVVLVENGSTDHTWTMCQKYKASPIYKDHLTIIHLPKRGKGAAVRAGMLAATGRYRLMMDCDLSTSLEEIRPFLQEATRYDVVIGSRELARENVRATFKRRLIGRVFHWLVAELVPDIHDTQCGFKLFRDYAAADLFHNQKITGMAFDVELLYLARMYAYSVKELPVRWVHDADSRVRLVGDSLSMLWDVSNIPYLHIKEKLPA